MFCLSWEKEKTKIHICNLGIWVYSWFRMTHWPTHSFFFALNWIWAPGPQSLKCARQVPSHWVTFLAPEWPTITHDSSQLCSRGPDGLCNEQHTLIWEESWSAVKNGLEDLMCLKRKWLVGEIIWQLRCLFSMLLMVWSPAPMFAAHRTAMSDPWAQSREYSLSTTRCSTPNRNKWQLTHCNCLLTMPV